MYSKHLQYGCIHLDKLGKGLSGQVENTLVILDSCPHCHLRFCYKNIQIKWVHNLKISLHQLCPRLLKENLFNLFNV